MLNMKSIITVSILCFNMVDMKHLLVEIEGLIFSPINFYLILIFSDSPTKISAAGDNEGTVNPHRTGLIS